MEYQWNQRGAGRKQFSDPSSMPNTIYPHGTGSVIMIRSLHFKRTDKTLTMSGQQVVPSQAGLRKTIRPIVAQLVSLLRPASSSASGVQSLWLRPRHCW